MSCFRVFIFAMLCVFAVITIAAQRPLGKINGNISYGDETLLHDARVQITQLRISTKTNNEGYYEFSNLAPGRYTLTVHIEGFSDAVKVVEVVANETATVDFQLELSGVKEEVTVTASGTDQTVLESFQSVTSVGLSQISERPTSSIGEVLENESGIAKRSFGPGSSRPVIRGFDGDRVLVLEDGARGGSVGSQSGDHGETADPLTAERIEVVKGPGTLLFGSNAIGGVVNVISNDENENHEGFRGSLTTNAASVDRSGTFAGTLEFGHKNLLFRGSLSAQRAGDFSSPIGRIPNSASRATSEHIGLGYYAKKAFVNLSYGLDVRRYGVPFATIFEDSGTPKFQGTLPAVEGDVDLRQRKHAFKLNGGFRELSETFVSSINYSFDYTDYRHKEIEINDAIQNVGTIFDNKSFSYRSVFEQKKVGRVTGRFGFDGFTRGYQVNGEERLIEGKVKHDSLAVFGLEELAFERVKFQLGGRVENNRYNPTNTALNDRSFTGFSGALGANFSLWKGGALILNYTNTSRAPALEELYNNGRHIGNVSFEIGNSGLRKENANGFDGALRQQSDRLNFNFDLYYYAIRNFVFLEPQDADGDGRIDINAGLPVQRYTQANAVYWGTEANADFKIHKFASLFLGGDYVRANIDEGTINLPRIPSARGRAGLNLSWKGLDVKPETIFVADQEKIFPLETRTAGYTLFNLSATYIIGKQHYAHIFSFNATNLADKLYRNHLSFIKEFAPEPGRSFRASYTVRFF